jgi:predicted GH43/DUF377 family glycosyl hydrolase
MNIYRYPENPLITPQMVPPSRSDFEVVCAFNAGVARYGDEVILLLRVAERAIGSANVERVPVVRCAEDTSGVDIVEFRHDDPTIDFSDPRNIRFPGGEMLTTLSHLRVARSRDGRHFTIDPHPAIFPDRSSEVWGLEDPRITEIDGTYYIAYKSVAPTGITTSLAVTRDFQTYEKRGIMFCPENLDVCIFPEKVQGRYVALHRPVPCILGDPNMWVAYSHDLLHWGDHHFLMGVQADAWDSGRIGGGAIPIRTEQGWLVIYHGATSKDMYCLGTALLDLETPHKVIARNARPLLVPSAPYETHGFMNNVIFCCGALVEGDTIHTYYGAGDWVMAGMDCSLTEILADFSKDKS